MTTRELIAIEAALLAILLVAASLFGADLPPMPGELQAPKHVTRAAAVFQRSVISAAPAAPAAPITNWHTLKWTCASGGLKATGITNLAGTGPGVEYLIPQPDRSVGHTFQAQLWSTNHALWRAYVR